MRVHSNQFLRILTALFTSLFLLTNSMADESGAASSQEKANPLVQLKTNMGDITVELNEMKAPISVKNFLTYVDEGFYNGIIFHRVIDGFMIQTGGFDQKMNKKKTKAAIKNEAHNGLSNGIGTLSMARTNAKDSATSQFFINLVNNTRLDHNPNGNYGYAVFGKVVEGLEVVKKIGKVKTVTKGYYRDVPAEPVVIISAKRI